MVPPPTEPAPRPTPVLDWFDRPRATSPGRLNLAYNALDRHVVRGLAEESALLHPFAPAGVRSRYSYAELLERVAQLAGGFRELGVRPGRAVVLALPLIPELVIGMLACARMGAVAVPLLDDTPVAHAPTADAPTADTSASVERLVHDPSFGTPAVLLVDAARKQEVAAALVDAGRSPDYQVVLRPQPGSLDASVGDIDLAVVMKPGAFQPGVCAELPPDSPFLLRLAPDADEGTVTYDHGWALDLLAVATDLGWSPGGYVAPGDDPTSASPYAALLAPLLVGAAIELR